MAVYICKECNYRLESNLPKKGKKCPYCGKGKITEEPSAEELLMDE